MTAARTIASLVLLSFGLAAHADETLYNGIRLPSTWPPRVAGGPKPIAVPYLASPPEVIPIDVGRQLFVDDFLIEKTDLARTYHLASYHPASPVLKPEKRWEIADPNSFAIPYSDGVWYDPQEKMFKMWYKAGDGKAIAYATSVNGIHWDKPILDVVKDTNLVHVGDRDSTTVWFDTNEKDPQKRYKLFRSLRTHLVLSTSPDGIHWTGALKSGPCGDRTTVFYNPFRKVWVFGLRARREEFLQCRSREYFEHADALAGANWKEGEPVAWVGVDDLDPPRPEYFQPRSELYNLDAVAYESVLLGLFSVWRGQPKDRPKINEVCVGFSRDGFHWHKPDRRAFAGVSERHGDWNWGNVQSIAGCCLVVGDQLYFYVSGRAGVKGTHASGLCSTGLALLRDGFASLDADPAGGTVTTRPVRFTGKHLLVNLAAADGELRAEVLDADGKPIPPFSKQNCVPVKGDKTLLGVRWKGADDLAVLAGKPVRFRFHLTDGKLYSFWVAPERSGASHGYVAAGGPGFSSPIDTVGAANTNPKR